MAIDSTHPDYDAMQNAWIVMSDVLAGEDAIKAAGDQYLPRFAEGDEDDWLKYKERATFFEITDRAAAAMNGFLFRKDPQMKVPQENKDTGKSGNKILQAFIDDATLTGKNLYDVAKDLADKTLGKARGGAWIDWSDEEQQPFLVLYCAEDIINWQYERIGGRMMLTMLMLYEQDTTYYSITGEQAPDEYEVIYYDQWRELRLERAPDDTYFVSVTLWRRRKPQRKGKKPTYGLKGTGPAPGAGVDNPGDWVRISRKIPTRRGFTLPEIPFVFVTSKGPDGRNVPKPPLYGMAKQNIKHYRTDADLTNMLHVLGMPTPYATGVEEEEGDNFYLGSSTCLTSSDANSKFGFLALQGTDAAPLLGQMESIEKRMAELGARMLDPSSTMSRAPEAYQTVALRQTGETAVLMNISLSLTQSMQDLLAWALWWTMPPTTKRQDVEDQVGYTLNTDFLGGVIDPALLTALMQAYLQKAISFSTLFKKLQSGEIIPPDVTEEEEKQAILDGEEMLMGPLETQMQLQLAGIQPQGGGTPPAKGAAPAEGQPPSKGAPKKKPAPKT